MRPLSALCICLALLTGCGSASTAAHRDAVSYAVSPDLSLAPSPDAEAASLWTAFRAVASDEVAGSQVATFEVSHEPGSDTIAHVVADEEDPARWDVGVNAAAVSSQGLLVSSLVHEYGHIVSLSAPQVVQQDPCPGLTLDEGCAVPQAYLTQVVRRWWGAYGIDPAAADRSADEAAALAAAHPGAFVSDYAATSPAEDFAETWAWFVLTDQPTTPGEANDKIRFLWDQPALVAERYRIRTSLVAAGLPVQDPAVTG